MVLTERDGEIFDALTKRVRALSIAQIARTWWPGAKHSEPACEKRLRLLAGEGLLQIERAPAHPELALHSPVTSWKPGEEEPDFGAVSYRLQSRWREHPVLTACVSATKRAAQRFGGYGGRPPRTVERTHDLHMAQVFLHYRRQHSAQVREWIFEEQLKSERRLKRAFASAHGEKLPDAQIRTSSGTLVVEFGGAYAKEKLVSFHGYCKEHSFPYEIW